MSDEELALTAKRLALLDAVADGRVKEHYPIGPDPIYSMMDRGEGASWPPSRWARVTAEIVKLNRAGLVALDLDRPRRFYKESRVWLITELGERKRHEARGEGREP